MRRVFRCSKAGDNKTDIRKGRGLLCVLAGTQVDGSAVGEGEYGGVVGGLVSEVGLRMKDVFFGLCFEQG